MTREWAALVLVYTIEVLLVVCIFSWPHFWSLLCILVCCILVSYWKQSLHRRVTRQKSYLELFGLCDSGLSHTGQATGRSVNNVYSSTSWQAAVGFLCNRLWKPDACMDRVQSMTPGNLQSLEKNLYSLTGCQRIHLFTKMQKDKIK